MEATEPLALKVMRLRRPQVQPPQPMPLVGGALDADIPKLLLPMSLTQSFVGEPFTGYLHLSNHSAVRVPGVALKVELSIGGEEHVLFDSSDSPIGSIEPGGFFDTDVEHELRVAGTYVLTCHVSYGSMGEQGTFRRSYRFPALQPFAVVHRVVQVGAELLVECAIENATKGSICLTSCRLDCAVDGLEASAVGTTAGGDSLFRLLKPRGAQSLTFRVSGKAGQADAARLRSLDHVGDLSLGWQVLDGPSGRVEGHQVRIKPCGPAGLNLRVVACPQKVRVEEPFQLELEVANQGEWPAEPGLRFDLRLMGDIRVHGALARAVGVLQPGCVARVPLDLIVTLPGLHGLQGVSTVDERSQVKGEYGVLCDILAL